MPQKYARPPITEAVIDIQLQKKMSEKSVSALSKRFQKNYDKDEALHQRSFVFDLAKGTTTSNAGFEGSKFLSSDGADIALVRTSGLLVSRLAPYEGWDQFFSRFLRDWELWKTRVPNSADTSRIGVRFINRIDIPTQPDRTLRVEDYFNVTISTPDPDMV